jgi:putative membrane protein
MLAPVFKKNDKTARLLILTVSIVVFLAIAVLSRVKLEVDLGFDIHVFALINAVINSTVSILLVAAYVAVRNKQYILHRNLMVTAILLSALFLVSYIAHHLLAGETRFGGEGTIRYIYYFVLITHILLAAIILPFILFTAYRALTGDFEKHKKLSRYTFPLWLYVSISGVLVYLLISPYYS